MPAKATLSIRLSAETLRRLDAVAAATRRPRSFIAAEALEAWIAREGAIIEDIRVGLEQARAGKVVPHERAMRGLDAAIERAMRQKRRRGAKRKERASRTAS
jgi:predicted transcriptional regulator